jgi:galactose mutarotase-like enzyme
MRAQVLEAGGHRAVIDLDRGARLSSLVLAGHEVLATACIPGAPAGILDGCFAMVPYAGRIRNGSLRWAGRDYRLPATFAGHAIHGTGYDRVWSEIGPGVSRIELTEPWPLGGWAEQRVALDEGALRLQLVVGNDDLEMPAWIGYHPWFRRAAGDGEPAQVHLDARWQYARGSDGLPTGELAAPLAGPWDDCFTGLRRPPRIVWPGWMELEVRSSHDHVVVFDELADTVCLEPQTGPPDAVRLDRAATVAPGSALVLEVEFRVTNLG